MNYKNIIVGFVKNHFILKIVGLRTCGHAILTK